MCIRDSRCADHVDDVALGDAGAHGIPVRIECAHGNGDPCAESESVRPGRAEVPGDVIRGQRGAGELVADTGEERVHRDEEFLRRESTQ